MRSASWNEIAIAFTYNISDMYSRLVQQLVDGLTDPSLKQQAINIIKSMIEYVTVTPENDGFAIDLHVELGRILEIVTAGESKAGAGLSQHSLSVVAGAEFGEAPTIQRFV